MEAWTDGAGEDKPRYRLRHRGGAGTPTLGFAGIPRHSPPGGYMGGGVPDLTPASLQTQQLEAR